MIDIYYILKGKMLKNVLFRSLYMSTLVVNVIYIIESYIRLEKGFVLFILKDKIY